MVGEGVVDIPPEGAVGVRHLYNTREPSTWIAREFIRIPPCGRSNLVQLCVVRGAYL